ncbi:MAG: glycosyltransferase family 4 protein [Leptospiraceae bacterium]|nr:glycosyltransferase family 4 protein [Leptospiraceae bacterium]
MKPNNKLKPRVGIDARPLSYGMTGNSRYLFEVLKVLSRPDSKFDYYLYSNKKIHPMFWDALQTESVTIRIDNKMPGIFWLNVTLPHRVRKDYIDILWGTLQLLPYRKLKIPSVVNYHDLNFVTVPDTMTKFNYHQHKFLSGRTMANADKIFCLSQNTYNEIHNYNPSVKEKLKVVYPGVSLPIVEEDDEFEYDNYILTVSTVEPRKNLSTLISAYIEAKEEELNFPYKLLIAGRVGWGENELINNLKSGFYKPHGIVFVENPSETIISRLYKNCKLFLFPTLHEGFGLPVLEALYNQKVCIVSDIPVLREMLDPEVDMFVPPKNVSDWKEAILKVYKENLWERGKAWDTSLWTWEKTAKEIEDEITFEWKKSVILNALLLNK